MFGNLDPAKILVVLVLALIVLGPERLPRVARQLGAAWRELTRVRAQVTEEVRAAMPDLDLPNVPRVRPGAVSGFLADLTRPSAVATDDDGALDDGALDDGLLDEGALDDPTRIDLEPGDTAEFSPGPGPGRRRGARVVVHPGLGDFSFPPDDPGMN